MEEETRYTKQDLETMRAWTLQRKIQVTQTRLIEWLGRYDWNVYVSFSGGKDSTVLPLYRFNVSPTIPIQRATVSAAVLAGNGRTPFQDAFIARMQSGHTGMFERDGSKRLPISEFMGPSTAQMAGNSIVLADVEEKAQEVINKRVEHEITRILNGYGG